MGPPGEETSPLYAAVSFRHHKSTRGLLRAARTSNDDLEIGRCERRQPGLGFAWHVHDRLREPIGRGGEPIVVAPGDPSVVVVKYLQPAGSWMHLRDMEGLTALGIASLWETLPFVKREALQR
jgi:hypothetical protein